jgi:hypothetical protein
LDSVLEFIMAPNLRVGQRVLRPWICHKHIHHMILKGRDILFLFLLFKKL